MSFDRLIDRIVELKNPTVAGLDPLYSYIPDYIKAKYDHIEDPLEAASKAVLEYNCALIDALHDIVPAVKPAFTAQCLRVPVSNGHMAAVFASFEKKISCEEIIERWKNFSGEPQKLNLPSAPKQFLHYYEEENRPQTRLDRMTENGMAVNIGRLREDSQYDYKFVCLSHNTLRGAAGGAVLLAELLCAEGYI